MNLTEIGHEIRLARKRQKLTQLEVCEAIGMSPNMLSVIEAGSADEVGIRKVMRLMDYIGLTLMAKSISTGYTLEDAQDDLQSNTPR